MKNSSLLQDIKKLKIQSAPEEFRNQITNLILQYKNRGYPDVLIQSVCASERISCELLQVTQDFRAETLTSRSNDNYAIQGDLNNNNMQVSPLESFDVEFYLKMNPDVRDSKINPAQHYFDYGWREGRDPNPEFSTRAYLDNNPDVARADVEPLTHYKFQGKYEGRRVQPLVIKAFKLLSNLDSQEHVVLFPTAVSDLRGSSDLKVYKRKERHIKLGVHLHVHYLEGLEDILKKLKNIKESFRLFVSCTDFKVVNKTTEMLIKFNLKTDKTIVKLVENKGRDYGPLLFDFYNELSQCEICLHIHNKKSIEKDTIISKGWRSHLIDSVLKDAIYVDSIIKFLYKEKNLELIGPAEYPPIREQLCWGKNYDLCKELFSDLALTWIFEKTQKINFPAGSFFWFKPSLLVKIRKTSIKHEDFLSEPIPDDGALPHAIERVLGLISMSEYSGYVAAKALPHYIPSCYIGSYQPEISIIIPFQNSKPWIIDCLTSVISQEGSRSIEVILVDNGSSDGSRDFVDALAITYPDLIRVIDETRKGAGLARNLGIAESRGKYITFVDADDVLPPWAIQVLRDSILMDENIDLVLSSLCMFTETGYSLPIPHSNNGEVKLINLTDGINFTSNPDWLRIISDFGPCAKLYRKDFLQSFSIQFSEGNYEDNYFICQVYAQMRHVAITRAPVYLYRKYKSRDGITQSTRRDIYALKNQLLAYDNTNKILNSLLNENKNLEYRITSILLAFREKCLGLINDFEKNAHSVDFNDSELTSLLIKLGIKGL